MSQANAYKNLVASRKQKPDPVVEAATTASIVPLSEPDTAIEPLTDVTIVPIAAPIVSTPEVAPVSMPPVQSPTQSKKRGRPATGKRSDEAWIGRTYYVQRETDLDVEDYLLKLKRQGIEIDKSELVDFMLAAWTKWQQGENIDILLDEFTPRQKS
jgi:hypothetical protein